MPSKSFDGSAESAKEQPAEIARVAGTRTIERTLAGRKVLVVHESPEITSVVADILADASARVTQANGAHDAALLLAWGGYDLIFLQLAINGSDQILELINGCRSGLLSRTIALTTDLRDSRATVRLKARYGACVFQETLLVDLVGLAIGVLARDERRHAA